MNFWMIRRMLPNDEIDTSRSWIVATAGNNGEVGIRQQLKEAEKKFQKYVPIEEGFSGELDIEIIEFNSEMFGELQ